MSEGVSTLAVGNIAVLLLVAPRRHHPTEFMSLSSTARVVASAAALATGLVAVVAWSRRRGRTPRLGRTPSLPNLVRNISAVIRDRLFNEGPRLQQAMGYETMRARQNSLANLLPDDELVKIFADLAGEE
jgi:hypothetical protein